MVFAGTVYWVLYIAVWCIYSWLLFCPTSILMLIDSVEGQLQVTSATDTIKLTPVWLSWRFHNIKLHTEWLSHFGWVVNSYSYIYARNSQFILVQFQILKLLRLDFYDRKYSPLENHSSVVILCQEHKRSTICTLCNSCFLSFQNFFLCVWNCLKQGTTHSPTWHSLHIYQASTLPVSYPSTSDSVDIWIWLTVREFFVTLSQFTVL
jgi:hypothetical protein